MPRRPKGKGNAAKKPRPVNREDGKLKRWNTHSDIPLDEEDQFHTNRDRILLNGEQLGEDEEDEDEVFALKGISEPSSEEEEEEEEQEEEEQEKSSKASSKHKEKKTNGKKASDVLDEDVDMNNGSEEEEEETWGSKKSAYYSTNAAHFDSEDEEANELEEQEAKRLHLKSRDLLTDEDFGLSDHVEIAAEIQDLTEPVLQVIQPLPQDKQSLIRHLEKTSPESLALARDWDDIAHNVVRAGEKLKKMESENPDALSLGMIHLHYQTLLTYATTLAFYLSLRSSPKYATQHDLLRKHPILDRLLTLKNSLATLEDLDFDMSDDSHEIDDEFDLYDDEDDEDLDFDGINDNIEENTLGLDLQKKRRKMLEFNELQELLKDAESEIGDVDLPDLDSSDLKKSRRGKAARYVRDSEPPQKKRKPTSKPTGSSQPIFDLVEPEFTSSTDRNKPVTNSTSGEAQFDAYGEQMSLQSVDAADKKARKKSLRFHTAKIESAAGRKDRGIKNALGGDDDIPYKERKKQKEIREAKELASKGRGKGGDDLSDTEPSGVNGTTQGKRKRNDNDDDDDDGNDSGEEDADGYYSLVQKRSRERKEQKKADYETARVAERNDLMSMETSDGPRGLTSAILKNRGLTPHRPKTARNPRVKKRMRFEKAKKKLSSQKAIYTGGEGRRYEGEKTGISKVVKAVRL